MATLSNPGAWGLTEAQFVKALYADGTYGGVIVATTTSQTNSTTAVPFTINEGSLLLLQPDAACYVSGKASSSGAAATTDTLVAAGERFPVLLLPGQSYIAVRAVSGTVNCQVRIKAS